jgi:hypothetical protein
MAGKTSILKVIKIEPAPVATEAKSAAAKSKKSTTKSKDKQEKGNVSIKAGKSGGCQKSKNLV